MSFVQRFRVTARKFTYFQKRLSKLGPSYYNCNELQSSCTRKAAQSRRGCPNCEYTIQYKGFIKELEQELRAIPKGTRKGARKWPSSYLLKLVVEAGSIANSIKGTDPKWPVTTSMMVSLYRGEVQKMQAIDSFNLTQTDSVPSNPAGPVEDTGDFD